MVPETELSAWLMLARVPGIGALAFQRLLAHVGAPEQVFRASGDVLRACRLSASTVAAIQAPDWGLIRPDLEWLAVPGHHCLTLDDAAYPRLLAETPGPPPVLYVQGDPRHLSSAQLAVVGSRNPSYDGRGLAKTFSRALVDNGITVTSGLAIGIDGIAHQAALDASGVTVAVLGCGLDKRYPVRHQALAAEIAEQGALVSEFPVGMPPRAAHFPRRNRIISGLSMGTLVVEATLRSGSLITARYCAEQGRELFAIPGSIHNPLARGCHRLIRDGAKLTETIGDILAELAPLAQAVIAGRLATAPEAPCRDPEQVAVLEQMGFAPVSLDVLCQCTSMPAERLSAVLLLLEMENRVISVSGGRYLRCQRQGYT